MLTQADLMRRFEENGYQTETDPSLPEGWVAYKGKALSAVRRIPVEKIFVIDENGLVAWSDPNIYHGDNNLQIAIRNLRVRRVLLPHHAYESLRDFERGEYQKRALGSLLTQQVEKKEAMEHD